MEIRALYHDIDEVGFGEARGFGGARGEVGFGGARGEFGSEERVQSTVIFLDTAVLRSESCGG